MLLSADVMGARKRVEISSLSCAVAVTGPSIIFDVLCCCSVG
ncbi:hypothetical protein OAL32_01210 [Synechococcus sp. AH-551-G15]|nr:hypothetical protein [Synechococcus sp. AH-551-G15]